RLDVRLCSLGSCAGPWSNRATVPPCQAFLGGTPTPAPVPLPANRADLPARCQRAAPSAFPCFEPGRKRGKDCGRRPRGDGRTPVSSVAPWPSSVSVNWPSQKEARTLYALSLSGTAEPNAPQRTPVNRPSGLDTEGCFRYQSALEK